MKKIIIAAIFAIGCFALQLEKISTTMQNNIDKTLEILKNTQGDKRKAADKIFAIFDPIFDYKLMAKLSLSKNYDTLNDKQKDEFNIAFETQLKKSFTDKLSLYKDQTLKILEGKQASETRYLLTSSMKIDGEEKLVVFKFYKNAQNDWLIYDVDLLGISIIQTYRTQFADWLDSANFDTLLEKLQAVTFDTK